MSFVFEYFKLPMSTALRPIHYSSLINCIFLFTPTTTHVPSFQCCTLFDVMLMHNTDYPPYGLVSCSSPYCTVACISFWAFLARAVIKIPDTLGYPLAAAVVKKILRHPTS